MGATGEHAIAGRTSGRIEAGEMVSWRARHFGRWWTLTSRVTEVRAPTTFADEQEQGPFRTFRHRHTFSAIPGGTLMVDEWEHEAPFGPACACCREDRFEAPFGPIGWLADRLVLGRYMRRLLEIRNATIRREAESGD